MKYTHLVLSLVTLALINGCRCDDTPPKKTASPTMPRIEKQPVKFVEDTAFDGLQMILREAAPPKETIPQVKTIKGSPLKPDAVKTLFSRTAELEVAADEVTDFAVRSASKPAPRAGTTVSKPFPLPETTAPPEIGPPGELEVLRFAPEGDIEMAPHLSITFSKPMVAISSQNAVAQTVPAILEPTPPGSWRWLGVRTLVFKPEKRFPMATEYRVTIPAGTTSINGDVLDVEKQFTFETPGLKLEESYPDEGPQPLSPMIFMRFNQAVSAKAVMKFITLHTQKKRLEFRPATSKEIEADEYLSKRIAKLPSDRYLAIVPSVPLPKDTLIIVTVKKGAPSAEGPIAARKETAFAFSTYGPLKITDTSCGYGGAVCRPDSLWHIKFNNPLKRDTASAATVNVSPDIGGILVKEGGTQIVIGGEKQGQTTYKVTISGDITDQFDQRLGTERTITFKVASASPQIVGPGKPTITLDPAGPKAFTVHVTNHPRLNVEIRRVEPSDWRSWSHWQQNRYYRMDDPIPLPGKILQKSVIPVNGPKDQRNEVQIPLEKHLIDGFGQFIVHVEQTQKPKKKYERNQSVTAWVQVTNIGLTAFIDNMELVAFVTRLENGAPLKGVNVGLRPSEARPTDALGIVKLPLENDFSDNRLLIAQNGPDLAILPERDSTRHGERAIYGWNRINDTDQVRWYTFDDRGMYRPKETARVKGWLRLFEPTVGGDITTLKTRPKHVRWRFFDSRGNEISTGKARLSAHHGFDIALKLPGDINLGRGRLELDLQGAGDVVHTKYVHTIEVQEFRRPEFEVALTSPPGPFTLGEEAVLTTRAAYYAGGGLPDAPVTWRATARPGTFTPPNRDDFQFGEQNPWWYRPMSVSPPVELAGETRPNGEHSLGIHFKSVNPPKPMSVQVEASVQDVNRQTWSKNKILLVHPADLYVGLKTKRGFSEKNNPIEVAAIVTNLDGDAISDIAVDMTMARIRRDYEDGKVNEKRLDETRCRIISTKSAQNCTFTPANGGWHHITATIKDADGRANRSVIGVLVEGGDPVPSRDVERETVLIIPETPTVHPKETARFMIQAPFYPAEGVLLIARSGIESQKRFTLTRATKTFEIPIEEGHVPTISVQVELVGAAAGHDDGGKPNSTLKKRVAFASGALTFTVPPMKRTLDVTVTPKDPDLTPGGKTAIDVTVKDADGKPVKGAELVIVAADEAVLALSNYQMPNPIDVFYASRNAGVSTHHSREQVVLARPDTVTAQNKDTFLDTVKGLEPVPQTIGRHIGSIGRDRQYGIRGPAQDDALGHIGLDNFNAIGRGGGGGSGSGYGRGAGALGGRLKNTGARAAVLKADSGRRHTGPESAYSGDTVSMRRNFDALALFETGLVTNAKGHVAATLNLPDSLTRYRLMVVAVSGENHFGKGESEVTASLPLMVRPSAPRFLNFGDRFELPVVLQNQTEETISADVGVRATNILLGRSFDAAQSSDSSAVSQHAVRVEIPPNDRVEVRFPAAVQNAGAARFQVIASGNRAGDASSFELPVYTPATTEAFATYGVIDDGTALHNVTAPKDVWHQFGGLELSTSSTQLQALTDAFLYLVQYPYDCNEQIASRLLAIIALKDVLGAFNAADLPTEETLLDVINADLKRLAARQGFMGGFGFWGKGSQNWPYLTVHVANALARTKHAGYDISSSMLNNVKQYLRDMNSHIPHWYSKESHWSIKAYAANTLWRLGEADAVNLAKRLWRSGRNALPLEAMGWLLPILFDADQTEATQTILKYLNNRVTETAAGAHFATSYSDGAHVLLHSSRRVDGIILEALIHTEPKSDLIPKLVHGLLAHRKKGRWESTQENAFVLLSLNNYFKTFEKLTPDFVARAWLGDTCVLEHEFERRTTERAGVEVPMAVVQQGNGEQSLLIQKSGQGRLYYRIGMRYAPNDLSLPPADHGFAVSRTYEAIDDENDVKKTGNTWHIKAGANVRVRLSMVAPMRRYHVALVDPLPAGLEAINPTLAVSPSVSDTSADDPDENPRYWWWRRAWYEHQNLRDERVEAFTSLLFAGVHTYTYTAMATTIGEFIAPPTRAEEMYHPETFGRSGTDRVVVE